MNKRSNLKQFANKNIKFILKNKPLILLIYCSLVIYDVLVIQNNSDILILILLVIYLFLTRFIKSTSRYTFIICLLLVSIVSAGYIISGTSIATEKAAVLLFIFLAIGILQQWTE